MDKSKPTLEEWRKESENRKENHMIQRALSTNRRIEVWEMKVKQGMTTGDIARALGISPTTVRGYFNEVMKEARESLFEDIERYKVEQHHKYDFIYAEAVGAWQRSKEDRRKDALKFNTPKRSGKMPDGTDEKQLPDEIKRTVEGQAGDSRFLNAAIAALQAQAKLWGLNEPERLETNNRSLVAVTTVTGSDEMEAIKAAEAAFRRKRYGQSEVAGEITGAVVPAVREDQSPEEGEGAV